MISLSASSISMHSQSDHSGFFIHQLRHTPQLFIFIQIFTEDFTDVTLAIGDTNGNYVRGGNEHGD